MLKSSKFVLHMSSYRDMVEYLAELSLSFHRDDLPVSSVGSTDGGKTRPPSEN